jgi:hypothetical protein
MDFSNVNWTGSYGRVIVVSSPEPVKETQREDNAIAGILR